MSLHLGDIAPDFSAMSTYGRINFHEWIGDNWVVFFSHPADYTPVCTTELGAAAQLHDEFAKRKVKVIALSIDPLHMHESWVKDINETQHTSVNYPIIADEDRHVSMLYDMIHPNASMTVTVRSVFVIGPDRRIKLTLTYPTSTGRNFNEILRVIDSLQLTTNYPVATPANWHNGDDCIIVPSMSNEEAEAVFPDGWTEVRPYLRFTTQPGVTNRNN